MSKALKQIMSAVVLLGLQTSVFAADEGYIKATVQQTTFKNDNSSNLSCSSNCSDKLKPIGLSVAYGQRLHPNFALETGFVLSGTGKVSSGTSSQKISNMALTVDAVGLVPVSELVTLSAKVGLAWGKDEYVSDVETLTRNALRPRMGLAAELALTKQITVGLDYTWSYFNAGISNATNAHVRGTEGILGLTFKYGL